MRQQQLDELLAGLAARGVRGEVERGAADVVEDVGIGILGEKGFGEGEGHELGGSFGREEEGCLAA